MPRALISGMDANADIVQQETSDDDTAPTSAAGAPRFAEQSVVINTGAPGSQPLRIPNQETTEGLFHNDAEAAFEAVDK